MFWGGSVCSEGKVCVLRESLCSEGSVCLMLGKCVCVCVCVCVCYEGKVRVLMGKFVF